MSDKIERKNVLIIDSRVLVRQMLSQILREEMNISNLIAMKNLWNDQTLIEIQNYSPDLIFLGIDSVYSKEFWLLKSIKNMYPRIPVVLLTSLTPEGARAALSGLKVGALEYITIPDNGERVVLAEKHLRKRVTPILKALPNINMQALYGSQVILTQNSSVTTHRKDKLKATAELVIIGGCMGGVRVLYDVISSLHKVQVPVIIVQHMPKFYTRELAADLDAITSLNVREAKENSLLLPGQVYVAPGGYHTVLTSTGRRNIIKTHRGLREMENRPSIDVLLNSAVNLYQNRVLGVFLSGGGSDGVSGAEDLIKAGGELFVQSRTTARLWDLPGKVKSIDKTIRQYHSYELGDEILLRLMPRQDLADSEIRNQKGKGFGIQHSKSRKIKEKNGG